MTFYGGIMNKSIVVVLLMGMVAMAGCSSPSAGGAQSALPTPNATQAAVKASGKIVAEGRVVPARNASLGFTAAGVVTEVLAVEGAQVQAGQVLVRLDSRQQQAAVAEANAALHRAQAHLDLLKAGPRPQEVQTAQASLDAAQAQLDKLQAGARPEDISAAAAAVGIAQAQLQQVADGASQMQIESARADLANAEAVLKLRQADFDTVKFQPGSAARPESLALEQATNNFESAKARYNDLAQGPTASALALEKARVAQAASQYASIKAAPRQADIDALKADIRRAQAQLDLVKAGSRSEDIAAAQADVDSAKAVLDQSVAALSDTELRSPFAGVLAYLNVRVGDQLAPATVIARVGDTSAWEIETTDLTELNIVNVKEGTSATVTVDALPSVEIPGKIVRMRQYGENKQGDIVYTVVIKPDGQNDRLHWNMTASVALAP
jgi:HlyD family secretion protein